MESQIHQNPLKTVGGVALTRLCLWTDQQIGFVWLDMSMFYVAKNFMWLMVCVARRHKFGHPMWLAT